MTSAAAPHTSYDLTWFKSSYSASEGGDCIEVAASTPTTIHVRDSKNPAGPMLTLSVDAWQEFVAAVVD
ncbi:MULTISPECIES: DUF397 domain-containing protein [Streptomyces]|uniref:DUF397 domain-containing protein n=1 Tax=Streptomyces siderophoricus TaxID=2802281 RepID=A0ABS1N2J9_9ACTN|nr:DUF397 domain-containing protein [Streptomyces sp. 9-7]MBL1094292.1 DUF397 domain-containing protein [Streptomyces sp. 9-7]